jgi:hypothetical protein
MGMRCANANASFVSGFLCICRPQLFYLDGLMMATSSVRSNHRTTKRCSDNHGTISGTLMRECTVADAPPTLYPIHQNISYTLCNLCCRRLLVRL